MNIFVTGHHITVDSALEEYVKDKLAKPLRHFDQIQSLHVKLTKDNAKKDSNDSCHAEAILRVSGQEMFVKAESEEMHKSINEMADMLTRQVRKHKTRLEKRYGGHQKFNVEEIEADLGAALDAESESEYALEQAFDSDQKRA